MILRNGCSSAKVSVFIFIALLTPLAAQAFIFGPSNYDECIQKRLKPGMSDIQSRAIIQSCRNEFPTNEGSDREIWECANGAKFANPHDPYKSYRMERDYVETYSTYEPFKDHVLDFNRVINRLDIISGDRQTSGYFGDTEEFVITLTNKLRFELKGVAVGFGPNDLKYRDSECSEMPVVSACSGSISSNRTGKVTCPKPPYEGFYYCIHSLSYGGADFGRVFAELMNTECSVVRN
jgi:hypothetical protein